MNKIMTLFALISIILLCSCNGNQAAKAAKEKLRTDSIKKAEDEKALKKLLAHQDSLADYAWGEIKFGMTKKEVLQTKIGKGGEIYDDCISMSFENRQALIKAFYLKELCYFEFIFENNQLIKIRIKSYLSNASEIDDLVRDCDIFINNFKKKMGDPELPLGGEKPNVLSFTSGKFCRYASFLMGGQKSIKSVDIFLIENDGYDYYYEITISNGFYPKKKKVKSAKEIEQEKKEEKERQNTVNNSF